MTDSRKQRLDGARNRSQVLSESRPLHIAALASIAIAQPLFDLLGQAPEFLLAHDLGPSEILAVVVALGAGLPLACALAIGLLGTRASANGTRRIDGARGVLRHAHRALCGKKRRGGIMASGRRQCRRGRMRRNLLSPFDCGAFVRGLARASGLVVIPALFLLRPGVQSLLWPQEHVVLHSSKSDTPVVFVVFDGMPLTALLDEDAHHRSEPLSSVCGACRSIDVVPQRNHGIRLHAVGGARDRVGSVSHAALVADCLRSS